MSPLIATVDRDWRLRLAAFARLEELIRQRGGLVTDGDLDNGFEFEGERIRIWDRRRGIWRPKHRDERGRPEVPNGLSLCKIHHGAYDSNILGVDPAYQVHIRKDVLEEHDGPMLQHGLQELHGSRITLPRAERHYPNREYLEERFDRFRAA